MFWSPFSVSIEVSEIKMDAINIEQGATSRLVRVLRVASPGQFYDCDVTGNTGHVMVLTPDEISKYPNGKRKLQEFLDKNSVNIVKFKLWSPRSVGMNVEVQLDSGQHKVIQRSILPGVAKSRATPVAMERWNIRKVRFRFRFQAGDYLADFFYVEWEAKGAPGEWIHENQLCFKPGKEVPLWRKAVKSVAPPPLAPCGVELATAEWDVFSTYFLKQVQVLIREGWRTTKSVSGRVRQGAAFPCTPAVRDQLLMNAEKVVLTKSSQVSHYTFYSAADLPNVFVGGKKKDALSDPWWYSTSSRDLAPGNTLTVLYAVIGDVTLHYSLRKNRMAISFDYTVLQSSTENIAWTRTHGCPLPISWNFFNPEDLKTRVLAKDKPYSKYFGEEEDIIPEEYDDAQFMAESEDEMQ